MINKVILVGNVGADPEVRTIESGAKVARIRMVTTERIFNRQSNETKEHSEWHTVIMWRGLADVADKYVRKGSQIYIEGNLRTRDWLDKENVKHTTTEVVAYELKLLGRRADNATAAPAPATAVAAAPATVETPADDPDDMPF
ncbi:MAG: single-stranded DNA-binding protein [Rikenellaceae bacterium]